jgi:hypothetical protein
LGVEETGTFQNALPSFGGRMIHLFHFSGRQFTALLGLDPSSHRIPQWFWNYFYIKTQERLSYILNPENLINCAIDFLFGLQYWIMSVFFKTYSRRRF